VRRAWRVSLYVNDAFLAHHNKPARARLRGLAGNPAISGALLRQLVDEYFEEIKFRLNYRRYWSDEQFDALVDYPDPEVRVHLADAEHVAPDQRARLVEDSSGKVLIALARGPMPFDLPIAVREPMLPRWAYERLIERDARLRGVIGRSRRAPEHLRLPRPPATLRPDEPVLGRHEAEELIRRGSDRVRALEDAGTRLPADLVVQLAADASPEFRQAASMYPRLTEQQRAEIDYRVAPEDRIQPARWAMTTRDPQRQRECVYSAHTGLRRSVAYNRTLSADLVAVLSQDDDFAVRAAGVRNHAGVPGETVLATYLEARTLTRGRLLDHPALRGNGLAHLASSSDPSAPCLVMLVPAAPPELVHQLSYDPHPAVRATTASDERLPLSRVPELLDDPSTTETAAANPHLPVHLMERILADAGALADGQTEGTPTIYLGNWIPGELPPTA
jgi:hypothetical protein